MTYIRVVLWTLHAVVLGIAVYFYPVNWDEGWTFCTARYWLEDSHFGCKINGNFTSARLISSWYTVLFSYAGFYTVGIGHIGGRLAFACSALLLIVLCGILLRKAFGKETEVLTLALLLTLSGDPRVHPGLIGAQAWGEIPGSLFFLLGVAAVTPALAAPLRRYSYLPTAGILLPALTVGCFVVSCIFKQQFRYFIPAACLVTALILLPTRAWAKIVLLVFLALATRITISLLPSIWLPSREPIDTFGMGGDSWAAYKQVAFVLDAKVRASSALWLVSGYWQLLWCVPLTILAVKDGRSRWLTDLKPVLPIACLSCVMLGWFVLLAADYPRYAAPGLILMCGFAAWPMTHLRKKDGSFAIKPNRTVKISNPIRLAAIGCVVTMALCNTVLLYKHLALRPSYNADLEEVAMWVETHVAQHELVFTYDSQLFFLLKRNYTYPPDSEHVLPKAEQIWEIDPADQPKPDWVILGDWSKMYGISVEGRNDFEHVHRIGDFDMYRRRRPALTDANFSGQRSGITAH